MMLGFHSSTYDESKPVVDGIILKTIVVESTRFFEMEGWVTLDLSKA
jgi:hypothetical protein